ncbi:hypothetical protein [Solitalea lacus]|uniref:hypothetical protein n=1 Tax=Solitalea lacus TaxID=2911172 RepID=UPI001EDA07AB|nr:hypothetical protein [Solitalea lacus]UKJ09305.1 hypothetical protein L2B55_09125 [Solitalea lacus]
MKKFCLYFMVFLVSAINSKIFAQDTINVYSRKSIPIENVIGNNRQYLQIIVNKPLSDNKKNGILSISSFAADYRKELSQNEYLTTVAFYQKVCKGLSANLGSTFNSKSGLRSFAGLQYYYEDKILSLFYLPGYYFINSQMLSNLLAIEVKPKISKHWSVYSRFQATYAYDFENNCHYRSYMYTRLGLNYQKYSFGVASNLDWYGKYKSHKENYGLFFTLHL